MSNDQVLRATVSFIKSRHNLNYSESEIIEELVAVVIARQHRFETITKDEAFEGLCSFSREEITDLFLQNKLRQWTVVGVNTGTALSDLDGEREYSVSAIEDNYGVNLGRESSGFHRCIVVSKNKYSYSGCFLAVPITTFRRKHEGKDFCVVIERNNQTKWFIREKSATILTDLRSFSFDRVGNIYGDGKYFVPHKIQSEVRGKLKKILNIY